MTLLASEFFQALKSHNSCGFPHYNIVVEDNDVLIELALAGYRKEDISISLENNVLTVSSNGVDKEETRKYYTRGIAKRRFCSKFALSTSAEVKSATMNDGLLCIRIGNTPKQNAIKITVN